MATKTTGAEFKRFYNDGAFWPKYDGNTWHEDEILTVNGVVQEEGVDTDALPDEAEVKIEGGIVFGPEWDGNEPSFEAYFKRWRKKQNTASFLVECDLSQLEAVKAAVKTAGGRVAT